MKGSSQSQGGASDGKNLPGPKKKSQAQQQAQQQQQHRPFNRVSSSHSHGRAKALGMRRRSSKSGLLGTQQHQQFQQLQHQQTQSEQSSMFFLSSGPSSPSNQAGVFGDPGGMGMGVGMGVGIGMGIGMGMGTGMPPPLPASMPPRQALLQLQRKIRAHADEMRGVRVEMLDLAGSRCVARCEPTAQQYHQYHQYHQQEQQQQQALSVRVLMTYRAGAGTVERALPQFALLPQPEQPPEAGGPARFGRLNDGGRGEALAQVLGELRTSLAKMSARHMRGNPLEVAARFVVAQLDTLVDHDDPEALGSRAISRSSSSSGSGSGASVSPARARRANSTMFDMELRQEQDGDLRRRRRAKEEKEEEREKEKEKEKEQERKQRQERQRQRQRQQELATSAAAAAYEAGLEVEAGAMPVQPCPRFAGACFSGPGLLVCFDSGISGALRSKAMESLGLGPLGLSSPKGIRGEPARSGRDGGGSGSASGGQGGGGGQGGQGGQGGGCGGGGRGVGLRRHGARQSERRRAEEEGLALQQLELELEMEMEREMEMEMDGHDDVAILGGGWVPRTYTELSAALREDGAGDSEDMELESGSTGNPLPSLSPSPNPSADPKIPNYSAEGLAEELTTDDLFDWALRNGSGSDSDSDSDSDSHGDSHGDSHHPSGDGESGQDLAAAAAAAAQAAAAAAAGLAGDGTGAEKLLAADVAPQARVTIVDTSLVSPVHRFIGRATRIGTVDQVCDFFSSPPIRNGNAGAHAPGQRLDCWQQQQQQQQVNVDVEVEAKVGAHGKVVDTAAGGKYDQAEADVDEDSFASLVCWWDDFSDEQCLGLEGMQVGERNMHVGRMVGRFDLVQTWTAVGIISDGKVSDADGEASWHDADAPLGLGLGLGLGAGGAGGSGGSGSAASAKAAQAAQRRSRERSSAWALHPCGRSLLDKLFAKYAGLKDVQTLAIVACVLEAEARRARRKHAEPMLSAAWKPACDRYRRAYADVLHRWGLHVQRAEVLKENSLDPPDAECGLMHPRDVAAAVARETEKTAERQAERKAAADARAEAGAGVGAGAGNGAATEAQAKLGWEGEHGDGDGVDRTVAFAAVCGSCGDMPEPMRLCEKPACRARGVLLRCALCQGSVRGLCTFCADCGHGGHAHHMHEWFKASKECAAGCGCECGLQV